MPYFSRVGISHTSQIFCNESINFSAAAESESSLSAMPVALPKFANFSYAPDTAKLKHSFKSIAFDIPCGTWKNAPIGRLIP